MQTFINGWCDYLLGRWQTASPSQFFSMAVVVITFGWLTSRVTAR
jgi:hypothetical protein